METQSKTKSYVKKTWRAKITGKLTKKDLIWNIKELLFELELKQAKKEDVASLMKEIKKLQNELIRKTFK